MGVSGHLIEGHLVKLVDEIPTSQSISRNDINTSYFSWKRLSQEETESFIELYKIIEEQVRKKTVRKDSTGKTLPGHLQPGVIKMHIDLAPEMKQVLTREKSKIDSPAARGYLRWILWDYESNLSVSHAA